MLPLPQEPLGSQQPQSQREQCRVVPHDLRRLRRVQRHPRAGRQLVDEIGMGPLLFRSQTGCEGVIPIGHTIHDIVNCPFIEWGPFLRANPT